MRGQTIFRQRRAATHFGCVGFHVTLKVEEKIVPATVHSTGQGALEVSYKGAQCSEQLASGGGPVYTPLSGQGGIEPQSHRQEHILPHAVQSSMRYWRRGLSAPRFVDQ